jgi:hypothetical protein|tara:strand:- start:578 stop:805 length:228 start_codon:yes stop_codon:yes gene_type:complete
MIAPPTIAIHSKPEACAFKSPKPSSDKVKIVGNIMELKKSTAKIDHIENNPVVFIEIKIMAISKEAKMPKTFTGA